MVVSLPPHIFRPDDHTLLSSDSMLVAVFAGHVGVDNEVRIDSLTIEGPVMPVYVTVWSPAISLGGVESRVFWLHVPRREEILTLRLRHEQESLPR
jgi:hypothetical protein